MTTDTEKLLAERATTHGEYAEHARITQGIMNLIVGSRNWPALTPIQRESLHMIAHKMGRICEGDPNHADHWDDISGYAVLVSQRLPKPMMFSPPIAAEVRRVPGVGVGAGRIPVHAVGDNGPFGGGGFTDANGAHVKSGDYVEYGLGSGLEARALGRGIVSDILQDGDATITYENGHREAVKWKNLVKIPRPVPVEDSNRHADRAPRDGLNIYEYGCLPKEEKDLYYMDTERGEYRLRRSGV